MVISLVLLVNCWIAGAESPIALDLKTDIGELTVKYKDQKLLVYAFASNQFKPYVRELYTLSGDNVLRDAPPDHLHHHGLMFAIRVNGTNFWEERDAPGVEKHVEMISHLTGNTQTGLPQARFTEIIHWVPEMHRAATNSGAAALLLEERTLTVTVDEASQEVALQWDAQFEVGPVKGKVTLHGANYNGLGLRLPESFNHKAQFQNSANQPYMGNNTQDVIPAQWTSVSGRIDGRETMLALFASTKNAPGKSEFFTMLDPFAYLSATQGLDKKPIECSAGERFQWSFLLAVYPQNKTGDFVRNRFGKWVKALP